MKIDTDLKRLIKNFPGFLQDQLVKQTSQDQLVEIILDLGRRPEARFIHGSTYLSQKITSWQDIDYVTKKVSQFSNENRAGIDRTLHRISCIRNRQFLINGLTCRIGRAVFGTISVIRDLLEFENSILVLGRPGIGKTTIVREIARVLADELQRRVIIIDTANEIAGDSDIPHPGIGNARRMQVAQTEFQHQVMIEAVENHMPQVIIIDEIGTELEVLAARTIAEKGVRLVGTTHGNCLENVVKNPSLATLIGGIQHVTLSDDEAKRRKTQKSILERRSHPAFEIIVEINSPTTWTIHENVPLSVDLFLRKNTTIAQIRTCVTKNRTQIKCKQSQNYISLLMRNQPSTRVLQTFSFNNWVTINQFENEKQVDLKKKPLTIYPYSLSYNLLKEALLRTGIKFNLTNSLKNADLVVGLKKHLKQNCKLKNLVRDQNIPIYTLNKINLYQVTKLIRSLNS